MKNEEILFSEKYIPNQALKSTIGNNKTHLLIKRSFCASSVHTNSSAGNSDDFVPQTRQDVF